MAAIRLGLLRRTGDCRALAGHQYTQIRERIAEKCFRLLDNNYVGLAIFAGIVLDQFCARRRGCGEFKTWMGGAQRENLSSPGPTYDKIAFSVNPSGVPTVVTPKEQS